MGRDRIARALAEEIAIGAMSMLDDERLVWSVYPIEMDRLERAVAAARGEVRYVGPPRFESPYRVPAR